MSETVEIKVRDNGPLKITGPVRILDGEGNLLRESAGESIVLCRCGHSATKPFCDSSHRQESFSSCCRAGD
jgi:CDGSH-type Zn-finger protein